MNVSNTGESAESVTMGSLVSIDFLEKIGIASADDLYKAEINTKLLSTERNVGSEGVFLHELEINNNKIISENDSEPKEACQVKLVEKFGKYKSEKSFYESYWEELESMRPGLVPRCRWHKSIGDDRFHFIMDAARGEKRWLNHPPEHYSSRCLYSVGFAISGVNSLVSKKKPKYAPGFQHVKKEVVLQSLELAQKSKQTNDLINKSGIDASKTIDTLVNDTYEKINNFRASLPILMSHRDLGGGNVLTESPDDDVWINGDGYVQNFQIIDWGAFGHAYLGWDLSFFLFGGPGTSTPSSQGSSAISLLDGYQEGFRQNSEALECSRDTIWLASLHAHAWRMLKAFLRTQVPHEFLKFAECADILNKEI